MKRSKDKMAIKLPSKKDSSTPGGEPTTEEIPKTAKNKILEPDLFIIAINKDKNL